MTKSELKRKLRELKKYEEFSSTGFYGTGCSSNSASVWQQYFSTKSDSDPSVRYNLNSLLEMDHLGLKEVFDEFFLQVYIKTCREQGINPGLYDAVLLSVLGLHPTATEEDIKCRFRELAKRLHPDTGGSSTEFIALMDTYKKLID